MGAANQLAGRRQDNHRHCLPFQNSVTRAALCKSCLFVRSKKFSCLPSLLCKHQRKKKAQGPVRTRRMDRDLLPLLMCDNGLECRCCWLCWARPSRRWERPEMKIRRLIATVTTHGCVDGFESSARSFLASRVGKYAYEMKSFFDFVKK